MFHIPYAKVVCVTLTSHQLRIQESNFALYFLEVYFYVLVMNPGEKRSACPEEQPKLLFMFGPGSLGGKTNKRGVQQSTKPTDDYLDEKLSICPRVQPTKGSYHQAHLDRNDYYCSDADMSTAA